MASDCIETEVLVLGCGIAGGIVALQLANAGVAVTIVCRSEEEDTTSTYYAQGGIVYEGNEDSADSLIREITKAGAGHNNPRAVRILAEEGPALVKDILIDGFGVPFDQEKPGDLSLVREGGHLIPRIIHVADATGKAIQEKIFSELEKHKNINIIRPFTAVDILTPTHHSRNRLVVYDRPSSVGAYVFDQRNGKVLRIVARKTVIATGGLGQIFLRTTNPAGARGDGFAMANRAGARMINNEFIQFHPTTFFYRNASQFLISEAVRGAGARLVNAEGQPFMEKYDPEWKDLAPRDVVARSIHKEMLDQDSDHVYLDLASYISQDQIIQNFPNIYQNARKFGVDITKDPAPVVPAAHYACGGIWVDEWGRTTLDDFYAVGEVACTGVHGANRLASTSLLEGVVWSKRTADHILKSLPEQKRINADDIPPWQDIGRELPDPALVSQDMTTIKYIMWNYVGLVRTSHRLQRAMRELRNLENEIERFYRVAQLTDGLIGLRNAVRTAIIVATAAWTNKNSLGCHYRE